MIHPKLTCLATSEARKVWLHARLHDCAGAVNPADRKVLTHARNAGPGKKSSSCEGGKPKLVKVAVSSASMPSGIMGMLMPCIAIQSSSASHLQDYMGGHM
jgi:hypothetical protein